ncbi:MAG: hypothetical protein M3365_10720 [Gemmatimonadota bacterium]|nr:hypothetical protein [Gemmatimonadota bacterium]
MNRSAILGFAITLALSMIFVPARAAAQCTASGGPASCTLASSASMTAGRVIRLQMTATSTPLTAPTPTDFDAGFNSTTGPTLTISANAAWRLYLRSSTAVWSAVTTSPGAPARADKPAGDLRWSTNAGGPFANLTTSDVTLASGNATASTANTLYFRAAYSWALDTPGDYGLIIVLSLTSP